MRGIIIFRLTWGSLSVIKTQEGSRYYKAEIYNPPYPNQKAGTYADDPIAIYTNGVYGKGHFDDLPARILPDKATL